MRAPAFAARKLLVVYFPLGDPEAPLEGLDVYADNGVDVVEFGWPARDPYLDGPDVRASMARALRGDISLALAQATRRLATRIDPPRALLMTYAEPGHPGLDGESVFGGLHALLVVTPSEDRNRRCLEARARRAGLRISVFLPLPLSEQDVAAARGADGYAMLQAAPGVTGPRASLDPANRERIARLRAEGVGAPVVVGFGVSQGAHARAAIDLGADGIVVGSAALRAAREGVSQLDALLRDMRKGLDGD